jgi:hypothetical protein
MEKKIKNGEVNRSAALRDLLKEKPDIRPKISEAEHLEKQKRPNRDVRNYSDPLCDAVGRGFLGCWHLRHLFLPVGFWSPWGSEHPDSDFKRAFSAAKRFGQTEESRQVRMVIQDAKHDTSCLSHHLTGDVHHHVQESLELHAQQPRFLRPVSGKRNAAQALRFHASAVITI